MVIVGYIYMRIVEAQSWDPGPSGPSGCGSFPDQGTTCTKLEVGGGGPVWLQRGV